MNLKTTVGKERNQPGPREEDYHALDCKDVIRSLATDGANGLSGEEARRRTGIWGRNELADLLPESSLRILFRQFIHPMVYLLLIAAAISAWLGEVVEAFAILVVIAVNAAVGFALEVKGRRSIEALRLTNGLNARVTRNGVPLDLPSTELVPGDLLHIQAGDVVPADARLLDTTYLEVNESLWTGESMPVSKSIAPLPPQTPVFDRVNMIYSGTFITNGHGRALVVRTGMNTGLGGITEQVRNAGAFAPRLHKKLRVLTYRMIVICAAAALAILVTGVLHGVAPMPMLKTMIALTVAAVPEGLPVVATLALARGALRMARLNVIVRHLESVETLGDTTVICTDKTGTLTLNEIAVNTVCVPTGPESFRCFRDLEPDSVNPEEIRRLVEISVLCNTAVYETGGSAQGDPLEVALLRFSYRMGVAKDITELRGNQVAEEPFRSETMWMTTVHRRAGGYFISAKGAPEKLLGRCNRIGTPSSVWVLRPEDRERWLREAEKLAHSGQRVLALAWDEYGEGPADDFSSPLIFAGLIGFMDPPAPGVAEAVSECRSAGIEVIMVTGDHPVTAANVADQVGIGTPKIKWENRPSAIRPVKQWIYARVSPAEKLDIVESLQLQGQVVAMTGDGVNDTPALRKADVGIAMGKRGTQVAREAADIVILDDNFASIVTAVREGRIIFDNIRKFILYLLSSNLSEILVIGIAVAFSLPFLLTPLQILFINLISDVLPALALGLSAGHPAVMKRPPGKPGESLVSDRMWGRIMAYAAIMTLSVVSADLLHLQLAEPGLSGENRGSLVFYALIGVQLLHVFNISDELHPLRNEVFRNKYVWGALGLSAGIVALFHLLPVTREALHLVVFSPLEWLIVVGSALLSLFLVRLFRILGVIR